MKHQPQASWVVQTARYYVHVSGEPRHSCHPVDAEDFETAAIFYAEGWGASFAGPRELSVIVVDAQTSEQQCFTLDLDTGDAEPCA